VYNDISALNPGILIVLSPSQRECRVTASSPETETPRLSQRTKYFSVKSVLRLVQEKTTSTTFRVPLSGDGRTSTALSE
jgi:hypothetical protein